MRTRRLALPAALAALVFSSSPPALAQRPRAAAARPAPQVRPHGSRVAVPVAAVVVDDGDSLQIRWSATDVESVRILGIDCPETRHPEHDLPYGQPFGEEARAFALGVFASATNVQLLRAPMVDPYGRTLGYLFVDGRNYSILVLRARLAEESISRYGTNGLPAEAATVVAAVKDQGPLPFESPGAFRARMRRLSEWLKARGTYPRR